MVSIDSKYVLVYKLIYVKKAISTLLQPPIVRTGLLPHTSLPASAAYRPPTARDIPPVTLTNIPHIEPGEFKLYLNQIGALYDASQRAKENDDNDGTQLFRRGSKQDDFADLVDYSAGKGGNRPRISRNASLASLRSLSSVPETPQPRRRLSGGVGRRTAHAVTPLSTIPAVYFEPDFHLENPRTFDVVSERSEVVKPAPGTPDVKSPNGSVPGPRKALATNAILQEKLSWYMDTIEIHLISSISTASTSFFAALGSLRELHTEAAESVGRIKGLREELETLDKEMAVGGLDIVNKRRRRENLKQLGDAVLQMRRVIEGVQQCDVLVDSGDVEKALDAIDSLEKLIAGETDIDDDMGNLTIRDLRGISALKGVTGDVDALRFRVGKSFELRFASSLLGDLRQHITSVSAADTLHRWSNASQRSRGVIGLDPLPPPTYLNLTDEFRSEMLAHLTGLHRANHTSAAATVYRDSVLREVKAIIRRPLPSSSDDDKDSMMSASTVGGRQLSQQEKSSILARNLRSLDPEDAETLLVKIYIGVGETLRRLGTQVKVLLDVTSTLGDPFDPMRSPPRSPNPNMGSFEARMNGGRARSNSAREIQEDLNQTLDMSNLLGQSVDMAQNQIVKVLRVRSEQSIHQPLPNFLRYFTLNLLFANECEAVSGRSGTALKTIVNGHIKEFVQYFGDSERQKLAQGMEADQWNAKDFTESDSIVLDQILSAGTKDAEAWSNSSKVWLPNSESPSATTNDTSTAPATNGKATTRSASIEEESFILPGSAILCLHGINGFLHLTTGIPSMAREIGTSLLEYLKLFNSRCTQLILGAGATRSAGLKNITTKHLALASQTLSFVSAMIPHIRDFISRHAGVNAPALSSEFEKLQHLFQDHQGSIFDKLVEIMSGRAATHVKAMRQIKWDEKSAVTGVNPYMETLVKETSTLHRVLTKHLSEATVLKIMNPVFANYREQWGKAFDEVEVLTQLGKDRYLHPVPSPPM